MRSRVCGVSGTCRVTRSAPGQPLDDRLIDWLVAHDRQRRTESLHDEIVRRNEKLDRDRFRKDSGGLIEAYQDVARRLGILFENERPESSGPVLVKS